MDRRERVRHDRRWKISASLLGVVALAVAGVAVSLVELAGPWEALIGVAVIIVVLLGGTFWLVPDGGAGRSPRTTIEDTHG